MININICMSASALARTLDLFMKYEVHMLSGHRMELVVWFNNELNNPKKYTLNQPPFDAAKVLELIMAEELHHDASFFEYVFPIIAEMRDNE